MKLTLIIACLYTYGLLPEEIIMLTDKRWNLASWSLNVRNFVEGQKDPFCCWQLWLWDRQKTKDPWGFNSFVPHWVSVSVWLPLCANGHVKQAHLRLRYSGLINTFRRICFRRICFSLYSSELQQQDLMLVPTWFAFWLHIADQAWSYHGCCVTDFHACVFVLQAAVFAHVVHDTHDMLRKCLASRLICLLFGLPESNLNMLKHRCLKQLLLPHQSMTIPKPNPNNTFLTQHKRYTASNWW